MTKKKSKSKSKNEKGKGAKAPFVKPYADLKFPIKSSVMDTLAVMAKKQSKSRALMVAEVVDPVIAKMAGVKGPIINTLVARAEREKKAK